VQFHRTSADDREKLEIGGSNDKTGPLSPPATVACQLSSDLTEFHSLASDLTASDLTEFHPLVLRFATETTGIAPEGDGVTWVPSPPKPAASKTARRSQ
jgi:hypothetical protein